MELAVLATKGNEIGWSIVREMWQCERRKSLGNYETLNKNPWRKFAQNAQCIAKRKNLSRHFKYMN